MTASTERLAQAQLEDRKEEDIKALKKKYACYKCKLYGINPAQGECTHCGGKGIEPANLKTYEREFKEIELRYSLNPNV